MFIFSLVGKTDVKKVCIHCNATFHSAVSLSNHLRAYARRKRAALLEGTSMSFTSPSPCYSLFSLSTFCVNAAVHSLIILLSFLSVYSPPVFLALCHFSIIFHNRFTESALITVFQPMIANRRSRDQDQGQRRKCSHCHTRRKRSTDSPAGTHHHPCI